MLGRRAVAIRAPCVYIPVSASAGQLYDPDLAKAQACSAGRLSQALFLPLPAECIVGVRYLRPVLHENTHPSQDAVLA